MRLIDADRLSEAIHENVIAMYEESVAAKEDCLREIEDAPTVDAVPVVRCKDCKSSCKDGNGRTCEGYWYELSEFAVLVKDDDSCSYGKRKDGKDG